MHSRGRAAVFKGLAVTPPEPSCGAVGQSVSCGGWHGHSSRAGPSVRQYFWCSS